MGDSQALVTGALMAMLSQYVANPDRGVLIDQVAPVVDEHGDYRPMLDLTMRSGQRLRVIVAETS